MARFELVHIVQKLLEEAQLNPADVLEGLRERFGPAKASLPLILEILAPDQDEDVRLRAVYRLMTEMDALPPEVLNEIRTSVMALQRT
jgi:hypothetical protein